MNKIRVGMDISQLAHVGGVNTYTQNLSEQLSQISDLEMVFFYSSLRKKYKGDLKNVKTYRLPPSIFEVFFNRIRTVSIEKFIGPIDIFHSSDWIQPPTKAIKVTTYHDVVPIMYPEWSHPKVIKVHKKRLELVRKEIDHVIAVSETTKKDLMEVSGIPPEKITVIYEAPTVKFRQKDEKEIEDFKKKYNLPDKFLLAMGGVGERRNLSRIREACSDFNLVITGQTIPWLKIDELELLYASASALLYCSLYEGFGIPILDAFSYSLPVITSNISSMPEVAGGAALIVDPLDVDEIRKKINMILQDKELRKSMIAKGITRVKSFSWEKNTAETVNLYERLVRK